MAYLKDSKIIVDADDASDMDTPSALLEAKLAEWKDQLMQMPAGASPLERGGILLNMADAHLTLLEKEAAWNEAREAFDIFLNAEDWENATQSCNILFGTEQEDSLSALGQGLWLAVTYPIDPELSVAMLEHVVEETPDDADGAAVAAATAHYLVELRADGKTRDNLSFYTSRLLTDVARRHSNVETQEEFGLWMDRLELNDPAKFLVRLRNVVDVLVQENWWFDREALQSRLPVH